MAPVTFEIPAHDRERAKRFYRSVFNWQITDLPDVEFSLISAASDESAHEGGVEIMGGIAVATALVKAPVPIITVDSIEAACERVVAAGGGRVTERQQVGEYGYSSYIHDCEGNVLCLWENP